MKRVAVVILAAGGSSRFGQPKQLVHFAGASLIRRAASAAISSECSPVIVVLGANRDLIKPELADLSLRVVENQNWAKGMGGSIRVGLDAVLEETKGKVDAALFMLCDQPMVASETLNQILKKFRENESALVASEYENSLGVPALFRNDLFPALLALQGAEGAKKVIARFRDQAETVSFPEGSFDIDTPEDLQTLNCKTRVDESIKA